MPGGWNVPYIVGDTLSRDFQYWPTCTPAEFATFDVPHTPGFYKAPRFTGITRDQLIAIMWRVREWRIEGHVTRTLRWSTGDGGIGEPGGFPITWDFDIPALDSNGDPPRMLMTNAFGAPPHDGDIGPDREVDIVKQGGALPGLPRFYFGIPNALKYVGLYNDGTAGSYSGPGEPLLICSQTASGDPMQLAQYLFFSGQPNPSTLLLRAWWKIGPRGQSFVSGQNIGSDFVVYDSTSGLFYPYIDIRMGTDLFEPPNMNTTGWRVYPDPAGTAGTSGTATFDPVIAPPFEFFLTVDGTQRPVHPPPNWSEGFGTAEFTITAHKFFKFSNTLGEDIYDEDTGAPTGADPFA